MPLYTNLVPREPTATAIPPFPVSLHIDSIAGNLMADSPHPLSASEGDQNVRT